MIERYDPFGRAISLRQMMDSLLSDGFGPAALSSAVAGV